MRTIRVPAGRYEQTVAMWAGRGWTVAAAQESSTVLHPPVQVPTDFSMWRALKLTVFTLGLYPLGVLLYWLFMAWWLKPLMAMSKPSPIEIVRV
jgi:hypothetical protein